MLWLSLFSYSIFYVEFSSNTPLDLVVPHLSKPSVDFVITDKFSHNPFLFLIIRLWYDFALLGKCRLRTTTGYCCVPFTYRRRRYRGCATNSRGQKWCAITPDFTTNKLWGYCRGGARRKSDQFFFVPLFLCFFSLYVVLLCISLPVCLAVSVLVSIASCLSALLEGRHTLRPQLLTVCLHSWLLSLPAWFLYIWPCQLGVLLS